MDITPSNADNYYKYLTQYESNRSVLWNKWRVAVVKFHQITRFITQLFRLKFEWISAHTILKELNSKIDYVKSEKVLVTLYNAAAESIGSRDFIQFQVVKPLPSSMLSPVKTTPQQKRQPPFDSPLLGKTTASLLDSENKFIRGFDKMMRPGEFDEYLTDAYGSSANVKCFPVISPESGKPLNSEEVQAWIKSNEQAKYLLLSCFEKPQYAGFVINRLKKQIAVFAPANLTHLQHQLLLAIKQTHDYSVESINIQVKDFWSYGYRTLLFFEHCLHGKKITAAFAPSSEFAHIAEARIQKLTEKQLELPSGTETDYQSLQTYLHSPGQLALTVKGQIATWKMGTSPLARKRSGEHLECILIFLEFNDLLQKVISQIKSPDKEHLNEFLETIRERREGIVSKLQGSLSSSVMKSSS